MSSRALRRRQIWLLSVMVLVVTVLLVSLYRFSPDAAERPAPEPSLALPTESVNYRAVTIPVHSRGTVHAARRIPLISEVGGRVNAVAENFREGAFVEPETTLVQLDKEPYQLEVARRHNELKAAELHREEVRANAKVARRNRNEGAALARFEPQMEEAESRVAAARAGRRDAELRLEKTGVHAPFPGRLEEIRVQAGQYVQAGTRIATLYSAGHMKVRLPMRDEWLKLLDYPLSLKAEVPEIDVTLRGRFAGREGQWQGHVVGREGGVNRNRMTFLVVAVESPPEAGLMLEPGVFVEAELRGPPRDNVAVLPRSVLAGDSSVWVLDEDNRVRRREVDIVHRDTEHLYIEGGLDPRVQVVRAGGLRLLEGMRVEPMARVSDAAGLDALDALDGEAHAQH